MKRIVLALVVILCIISCTDFVTVRGIVVGREFSPNSGFGGQCDTWYTFIKTDTGILKLLGVEAFYDLRDGDYIEYTYDRNRNSFKSTYRIVR